MDTPENREAPIRVHFGSGLHAAAGRPVDAAAYEQYLGRWSRLFVPAVLAAAEVASGDRVLDVATGPGETALSALSKVTPAGRVIGADISPAMLTAARARLGGGAIGLGEPPAAPQASNLLGVDLVVFRLAAMEGLHVESLTQDARDTGFSLVRE